MSQIGNCPFGFEDGHVVGYEADSERLLVPFEFWNEERGTLVFAEFAVLHDNGAIGATIGATEQERSSELIGKVVRRLFEKPPESVDLAHFRFLDVDGYPVLEIVARSCTFIPQAPK